MQSEKELHKSVVRYVELQHKGVILVSDGNGVRLTMGQSRQAKALRLPHDGGHPDIFIFEPRGRYHGLFIELKAENKNPFKKNGELKANEHLLKQHKIHAQLRVKGYCGGFAAGFDAAKAMIDDYFRN